MENDEQRKQQQIEQRFAKIEERIAKLEELLGRLLPSSSAAPQAEMFDTSSTTSSYPPLQQFHVEAPEWEDAESLMRMLAKREQGETAKEELESCLLVAEDRDVVKGLLGDPRLSVSKGLGGRAVEEAVKFGRVSALEALLQAGFSSPDALCLAADGGHLACLKTLLRSGGDLNQRYCGRTALHLAAKNSHDACVRVLLDAGANVEATDNDDWTALHFAADVGATECARTLINAGADISASYFLGNTPLKLATEKNHSEIVRLLREKGETSLSPASTSLLEAAKRGDAEYLQRTLAKRGQGKTSKDELEECLLNAADGHVVRALLGDSRLSVGKSLGDRAINQAVWSGRVDALEALVQAGITSASAVLEAAEEGNADRLRLLLRVGCDCNTRDEDSNSALHLAAKNDHKECLQVLLDAGAVVEAKNDAGWTPLHEAAGKGATQCAYALIDVGADVDALTFRGSTPMMAASCKEHADVVRILLNAGADVGAAGENKCTALHYAASWGATHSARLLIDAGADVNASDSFGNTPLKFASDYGHTDIVYLLRETGAKL